MLKKIMEAYSQVCNGLCSKKLNKASSFESEEWINRKSRLRTVVQQ